MFKRKRLHSKELVSKVAEYLSIAPHLTPQSPDSQYQRANQLILELAVWLDSELYKTLVRSFRGGNFFDAIIELNKRFGDGKLDKDFCAAHAPHAGEKQMKAGMKL